MNGNFFCLLYLPFGPEGSVSSSLLLYPNFDEEKPAAIDSGLILSLS